MSERRDWVDIIAMLLLALAAVATAWSSYQANRWSGEQAKTAGTVNKTRIEAARASALADAQTEIDVATFMEWVDAYARDDTELTRLLPDALPRRVQAGLRRLDRDGAAHDARTRRRRRSRCPSTSWPRPRRPSGSTRRRRCSRRRSGGDIQRSSNYVLGVVLFAVALFFAGMSAKLNTRRMREVMLDPRLHRLPRRR